MTFDMVLFFKLFIFLDRKGHFLFKCRLNDALQGIFVFTYIYDIKLDLREGLVQ